MTRLIRLAPTGQAEPTQRVYFDEPGYLEYELERMRWALQALKTEPLAWRERKASRQQRIRLMEWSIRRGQEAQTKAAATASTPS
jgi:hypothetical protein